MSHESAGARSRQEGLTPAEVPAVMSTRSAAAIFQLVNQGEDGRHMSHPGQYVYKPPGGADQSDSGTGANYYATARHDHDRWNPSKHTFTLDIGWSDQPKSHAIYGVQYKLVRVGDQTEGTVTEPDLRTELLKPGSVEELGVVERPMELIDHDELQEIAKYISHQKRSKEGGE